MSTLRRLLVATLLLLSAAPAAAAPIGYDVSYPLCGLALPAGAAFAVVGVNGGLANNGNPCLATELIWAAGTPGLTSPVSFYLNTADPGNRVPDWPAAGGVTPFGSCDGSWSPACAYLYGLQRATASYQLVGAPTGIAPWWLDVETVNTWAKPGDLHAWVAVNVAAIQGFAAGLRGAGANGPIGLYSAGPQWQQITGGAQFGLAFPDWYAGVGTLAAAQAHCQTPFSGGGVRLVQFAAAGGFDGDFACPTPVPARLRISSHARSRGALTVAGTVAPGYAGRVTVALSALDGSRPIAVKRQPYAVGGSWRAVLRLPVHGRLHAGRLTVSTPAALGVLAGAAHASVRL